VENHYLTVLRELFFIKNVKILVYISGGGGWQVASGGAKTANSLKFCR
jgi:hypothetical protein